MNLSHATAVLVASIVLAAPVLAQQQQNRPATPPTRPPDAPAAPVAEAPNPASRPPQPRSRPSAVETSAASTWSEILTRVSEATGKKFFVDPRVRAQVYGVPRIENPTYAELLTILRIHGYVAVEVGGRVNIVPDALARFMPTRVLNRDDDSVPDDEIVTRIITTPNAQNLVPVLRPLMSQSAHLSAVIGEENEPGKLILMDTYANIRRMTELINTLSR